MNTFSPNPEIVTIAESGFIAEMVPVKEEITMPE
jgi:hypothetical protein